MKALALDPGSRFVGWANSEDACGTIEVHGDGDLAAGLVRFERDLSDMLAEFAPRWLIIERPFFAARMAGADFVYAVVWSAHAAAYLHEVWRAEMSAQEVRRHWWGRHKPTDSQRIHFARSLGFAALDNHAADAALLLRAWQERPE